MSTWHQRMLPYPLLAPWTEDYEESAFSVDVPEAALSNGRQIKVTLSFQLNSETLRDFIENEQAQYIAEASCTRTFNRSTHVMPEHGELVLDASEYDKEFLITPYVVATKPLEGFTSSEHAGEWHDYRPQGFDVPTAGILAVGNSMKIILEDSSVSSVIDLVSNSGVSEGTFSVQLDDERIKIHVPVGEKEKIEAVRARQGSSVEFAALFPGLYLHAVAEALRNLVEYENTRWASAVRNSLDRSGHGSIDAESLRECALEYAQELMDKPIAVFLSAAVGTDDED